MILSAHFAPKKPNMKEFFRPALEEIRHIQNDGGIFLTRNNNMFKFLPILLSCSCDLPARADVQGMKGHSGYFGCGYCLNPGELVKSEKSQAKVVRYTNQKQYEKRTHGQLMEIYAKMRMEPSQGVKNVSCMIAAEHFDLVNSFAIDYMHCVLLGIMKKLFSLWLDSINKAKPFYIKAKDQVILSNRLVNIKPVSEIVRKPKSIFKRGEYKANEYRNMLIFYLWFALSGLLNMKYLEHFRLLSSSIYLLLKKNISNADIAKAETQLSKFASKFEDLYGKSNVTMNLHLLNHLVMNVKNLGPLWAQSMFAFEANNGVIVKSNTCNDNILNQLAWKYSMRKTIPALKCFDDMKLGGKKIIKLSSEEKQCIDDFAFNALENDYMNIYQKVVIRGIKFSSNKSKEISTIDYFILSNENEILCVKFYFAMNSIIYALTEKYSAISVHDQFRQVVPSQTHTIVGMNDVCEKLLYIKIGHKAFVTTLPNRYEKV